MNTTWLFVLVMELVLNLTFRLLNYYSTFICLFVFSPDNITLSFDVMAWRQWAVLTGNPENWHKTFQTSYQIRLGSLSRQDFLWQLPLLCRHQGTSWLQVPMSFHSVTLSATQIIRKHFPYTSPTFIAKGLVGVKKSMLFFFLCHDNSSHFHSHLR